MDRTSWTGRIFWTFPLKCDGYSAPLDGSVACLVYIRHHGMARGDGINGFNSDIHAAKDVP